MWIVAFRDLAARRRRFAIAIAATALVFAITLLLSGISASIQNEMHRMIRAFRVDAWVVPAGAAGAFTSTQAIPAARAAEVAAEPGVTSAAPIVVFRQTTQVPKLKDLNMFGYEPGGLGAPPIASGRAVQRDGEIVVDSLLGRRAGESVTVSDRAFRIVGVTHGLSYTAGTPAAFVTLHDAQQILYGGQPLATTIVTRGIPQRTPAGLVAQTNAQAHTDMGRGVRMAASSIQFLSILLWAIAAGIIGAILYMAALERTQDFAVMKATGASNNFITVALGVQALVLAFASGVLALALATALKPLFPMSVEIAGSAYALLFVVAIVIGLVASVAGLRRAISVDPALAFAG